MNLYHTTPNENVESILKMGLVASSSGIVYLSEKADSWKEIGTTTFSVNMNDIGLRLSTFNDPDLDEVLCWGDIEPDRLKIVRKW